MFSGYFLGYFFRTIKILEKSKDLQIDHQASFLMPLREIKVEEKLYYSYTIPSPHSTYKLIPGKLMLNMNIWWPCQ